MYKIDKKIILISALCVLGAVLFARDFLLDNGRVLTVNGEKIKIELATTPRQHAEGLSGRDDLCRHCGMLFVFEKKDIRSFWMRDMRFDLDMLWIEDRKIVQIDRNVSFAGGVGETRKPKIPVDKVLEIKAGESDRLNIKEGDEIHF